MKLTKSQIIAEGEIFKYVHLDSSIDVITLTGLSGVGKDTLAKKIAKQDFWVEFYEFPDVIDIVNKKEYSKRVLTTTIPSEYEFLTKEIDKKIARVDMKGMNLEEVTEWAKKHLPDRKDYEEIFDDTLGIPGVLNMLKYTDKIFHEDAQRWTAIHLRRSLSDKEKQSLRSEDSTFLWKYFWNTHIKRGINHEFYMHHDDKSMCDFKRILPLILKNLAACNEESPHFIAPLSKKIYENYDFTYEIHPIHVKNENCDYHSTYYPTTVIIAENIPEKKYTQLIKSLGNTKENWATRRKIFPGGENGKIEMYFGSRKELFHKDDSDESEKKIRFKKWRISEDYDMFFDKEAKNEFMMIAGGHTGEYFTTWIGGWMTESLLQQMGIKYFVTYQNIGAYEFNTNKKDLISIPIVTKKR